MDVKEILKDLVSYNTIKDKENKEILDYIQSYLEKLGFKREKREKYLIMSIGDSRGLGFIGHSDTVEITEGWSSNPLEMVERDGKLFGLGVCDMKGGIAAFLKALEEINLKNLKRGIKIYITYDEEIGFSGIQEIVKSNNKMPEYIVVGEPTNNEFLIGGKGVLEVKLNAIGKKVHSSTPEKGKSANLNMIKFLNELSGFYEVNIKNEKINLYEVPYTTMNIGIINGGSAVNSVSAECESYIDFRIAKNEHIDIIKEKINKLCEKYEINYKFQNEIEAFYEDIDFIENKKTANFMTEASFVDGKRIILGVGSVTAHEINENITVESLNKLVEQYKKIIEKICNF